MIKEKIRYGYNDLCIVPAVKTSIESRSECDPFYKDNTLPIFASPMSAVVSVENFHLWERNNIIPILPRNIDYNIRYDFLRQGKWVALSLTEFEDIFINNDDFVEEVSVIPHVLIDVANGHMQHLIDICKKVKRGWGDNIVLMAGNIANPDTYIEYCEAGIDYVRCSIGSGSCCTTASNTAVHYPIASLIDEINTIKESRKHIYESAYDKFCTKIIADGGIRNFSDVVKALALGADYVMIGGVFASFIESAGEVWDIIGNDYHKYNLIGEEYISDLDFINKQVDSDYLTNKLLVKGFFMDPITNKIIESSTPKTIFDNREGIDVLINYTDTGYLHYYIIDLYNDKMTEDTNRLLISCNIKKRMYGMSTKTAQRLIKSNNELKTSEGIEKTIDVKYTMKQWTENMIDYLKSAMSYCGCTKLSQFIGKQTLVVQSSSEIFAVNK
jgi:IMP dehydrogenase/GMP reductase